jgi:hypothetical protein
VLNDKTVHDFENRSHAVPGLTIHDRGETYDIYECGVHLFQKFQNNFQFAKY